MKTKFFKKLSFVLAVAMVLSVLYPAAGAFAAKKPKLNATSKYLHLDVEGKNEYDFNISNKQKGWKYDWESANEDVAVVDSKGVVTATGVGKTKVTVYITDKDGEEVAKLSATVTVRDNIKEVKITNIPEGNKLAVGQENDFNRSFVTNSGSTKKTSSITRWTVEPADGATIDDSGVFKATKAGKYTITARSFQSKAKYESWLKDSETYKDYVLATDSVEITVAPSMVEAKQVDLDSFKMVFDSPVDVNKDDVAVYQLVNNTKVKQVVAKATLNDDKTVATVDLYIPFTKGATYVVEYPEMESRSFVAATTNPEDVAAIEITTTTVEEGRETDVEFNLYNNDGVIINTSDLEARVTMEAPHVENSYFNGRKIIIFKKGVSVTVTATYHTYKYDSKTGEEVGNIKTSATIVGIDPAATNITGLDAWTITTDSTPDYDNVNKLIAVDDQKNAVPRLFVRLNAKLRNDTLKISSHDSQYSGNFEFVSSNENILIVDKNNGYLYPVSAGEVIVVVKYGTGNDKVPVATITITVAAKSVISQVLTSVDSFDLSNFATLNDSRTVKFTVKDQLGRAYTNFSTVKVERLSAPLQSNGSPVADQLTSTGSAVSVTVNGNGEFTLPFAGASKAEGTYVYKVTVGEISRVITVTVKTPNQSTPAYYSLELSATSIDMKVNSWDSSFEKEVTFKIVGYAANGVKLVELTPGSRFKVEVEAPYDPTGKFSSDPNSNGTYKVVINETTASGTAILKAPVGTYVVTAYDTTDNDRVIGKKSFVTSDTQPVATLNRIKHQNIKFTVSQASITDDSTAADLLAVVNDALEFKVAGNNVTLISVSATGTPDRIAIKSVKVRYNITATHYIDFTVNLNGLLLVK